ncbi:hypothetical protein SPI_07360 [Niveomyces insectorum RCEF 264]|uniref:Uncharacterized protein n=1 Tax=Niveomyces insectorum RCEF 264 TaxID=1081102 RepID=A0A167PSI9_9HYPO|nr:hypothetical protein SPI_07360 [Niveomyces insectorum RCEF 264]
MVMVPGLPITGNVAEDSVKLQCRHICGLLAETPAETPARFFFNVTEDGIQKLALERDGTTGHPPVQPTDDRSEF